MPEREGKPPQRRAAALRYEGGGAGPKVVAAGQGLLADKILAAAREAGVPVREDAALVEALAKLDLGAHVPEELFTAVAESLVWAYRLDTRSGRDRPPGFR